MRRLLRLAISTTLAISLLAFFVGMSGVLYVRSALQGGALNSPNTCMAARDMEKLRSGPDQKLADGWISHRVYEYHIGDNRSPGRGWRGALSYYGMKLGMSPAERLDLAYASMRPLRICGQRIREA
jgi:hypothetical protein